MLIIYIMFRDCGVMLCDESVPAEAWPVYSRVCSPRSKVWVGDLSSWVANSSRGGLAASFARDPAVDTVVDVYQRRNQKEWFTLDYRGDSRPHGGSRSSATDAASGAQQSKSSYYYF